jgi:endonuclease/exonuclease/phosphatase family metal-dependent hydrolase
MAASGVHDLTVATYNVHSSVGRDRRCSPDRILRVLAELKPTSSPFRK